MSSLEPSITAVDLDNKDNMLEHLEKVDETVSEQKGDLPSYKLWQNNAAKSWWKDKGLRRCMFDIGCLFGSIYANGYDQSVITSLQANESWLTHFNPNSTLLGLMVASYSLPNLIFPLLGSYLADRFGRKPVIWVASLCGVAGPLLSGLGGNVGTFIGGRVITGDACSFFQVTAAPLIAEIAHPRFRAVVSATYLCTWYIGAVVCGLIGIGMVQWGHSASWRVMTVLQCLGVLPLVIWSALPWMAESPRFLIKKGKNAQALRILADLHANGDQQDDLVVNEYREICTSVEIDVASSGARYLDFFKTPGNRKRLGLIAFISWAQTMSGNNLIGYYLPKILELAGLTSFTKIQAFSSGFYAWLLVVGVIAAQLVERLGRRRLLMISLWGLVFTFAMFTALSGSFAKTGNLKTGLAALVWIFLTGACYVISLVPLPYLYIPEILPYHLRSKGMAVFSVLTACGQVYNAYVNAIALDAIGWKYYIIFIISDLGQAVIGYFIMVETKGLTLEDIEVLFDGPHASGDSGR